MLWVVHIFVSIKLPSEIGGRLKIAIKKENSNKSELLQDHTTPGTGT